MTSANQKPSRTTDSANAGWLRRLVRLLPDDKLGWAELIYWVVAVVTLGLIAVLYYVVWNGETPAR